MTASILSFPVITIIIVILIRTNSIATSVELCTGTIDIQWSDLKIFVECQKPTSMIESVFSCLPEGIIVHDNEQCEIITTSITTSVTSASIENSLATTINRQTANPFECVDQNYIPPNCTLSNDGCTLGKPCENQGTCIVNKILLSQYECLCLEGFSGFHCEHDDRICNNYTCWHDGECLEVNQTVSIDNRTTSHCICKPGYDGPQCELTSDMCVNITCENHGICHSSHLAWECKCLGESYYSGLYCEHKSSELLAKEILSKSFALIAILAIVALFLFVISMDVLKYVFKIDPVDRERRLMKIKERQSRLRGRRKRKRAKTILKFFYIT